VTDGDYTDNGKAVDVNQRFGRRKEMREIIKNTKGAVTVFVTLMLIPAILVSGTAVDLARIHTARSILQDANQLAANTVLSQYNALLYDLYGLFGVAEDDPVMAELLDNYIKVSIFGESGQDRSLGTLQIFYGSNISLDDPLFADDKNLRNENVLRRQIEEYMKFRGPVIIVQDMLDLLGSSTFKEDTGVINDKLEIESAIAEIHEKYKELYDAIIAADKCDKINGGIIGGTVGTVSSSLDLIRLQFVNLKECYEAWEKAEDPEVKDDYAAKYKAILTNIRIRTIGGRVGSNWVNGRWQNVTTTPAQGLNVTIERSKDHADTHKPKFDAVVNIARQIDSMKSELSRKINELERRINNGECNEELRAALTERTGSPSKSMIERYRDILNWNNIENMAIIYKDGGYRYIDEVMKPLLDDVRYRNANNISGLSLSRIQLENILTNSTFALSSNVSASNSRTATLAGYTKNNISYNIPPGFHRFGDYPGDNQAFFEELTQMMNQPDIPPVKLYDGQSDTDGSDSEDKQRNLITGVLDLVSAAYAGLTNDPLGAQYINSNDDSSDDAMDTQDISNLVSEASNEPVANVISDPLGSVGRAADYILLLSYCTSVFSNYTTARPDSTGKSRDELSGISFPKSVTGIPLSPEVNYFFQSEWEYLYNGSENAGTNLSAVSRLIYIVRLVCNYITVFSVSEVNIIVTGIRVAFAWSPLLALILGELARAAFVAAESAIDVAILRSGYKVPFIKSGKSGEWICSPSGVASALADITAGTLGANSNDDKGLSYSNYLTFFFLAKALTGSDTATELAKRTADLIEWNIINYKNSIYSDEDKMTEALSDSSRFKLLNMKTDFSLTATADMRMLFLSMLLAQNFSSSRGIGISATMPVTVTDHRGY